jgi:hypothetical protein
VKQLGKRCDVRIALSGTPVENCLGELHSLFDYVIPGYLGKQKVQPLTFSSGILGVCRASPPIDHDINHVVFGVRYK